MGLFSISSNKGVDTRLWISTNTFFLNKILDHIHHSHIEPLRTLILFIFQLQVMLPNIIDMSRVAYDVGYSIYVTVFFIYIYRK